MKNSWLKLLVLVVVAAMSLSLFACGDMKEDESGTNAPSGTTEKKSDETTESKTEQTTEKRGETTSADGENTSETDSTSETETSPESETPTDSDTATETDTETVTETDTETVTETDTETEEVTTCHPKYEYDESGHWSPACDVCGKGKGKVRAHSFELRQDDEGDVYVCKYYCTECGYVAYRQEISHELAMFISPAELASNQVSGFSSQALTLDDGFAFARFGMTGSRANPFVYAYNSAETSRPTGKFAVIKVRLGASRTELHIGVSTLQSTAVLDISAQKLTSDWATVVIDLTKAVDTETNSGYVPSSGDFFLKELRIYCEGGAAIGVDDYFDVAYVMLCDTMEQVNDFTSSERGLYTYPDIMASSDPTPVGEVCMHTYTYDADGHKLGACTVCGRTEGTQEAHSYDFMVDGRTYSYACICGYAKKTKTVPESVSYYVPATTIINHITQASHSLGVDDDGTVYTRIDGFTVGSGEIYVLEHSSFEPGKAKFAVIKLRTNVSRDSAGDHALRFYISHENLPQGKDRSGVKLTQKVLDTNDWLTVVVDMDAVYGANGYVADSEGNYPAISRVFANMWAASDVLKDSDYYYDYEYIGFCSSWAEIAAIADTATVEYQTVDGESVTYTTSGEPYIAETVHTYGKDGTGHWHTCEDCEEQKTAHTYSDEVVSGTTYTKTCTVCGYQVVQNKGDSRTTFISASYLDGTDPSNNIVKKGYSVDADGTAYVRYKNETGGNTYGEVYPVQQGNPKAIVTGTNKYIVFKIRSSASIYDALRVRVGHNNGGPEYNQNSTYGSVTLNREVVAANEWKVFVIDMTAVTNYDFKLMPTGAYPELTNNNIQIGLTDGQTVDIAYVAFCADWTAIDALVDETTVEFHNGTTQTTVNADGTPISAE